MAFLTKNSADGDPSSTLSESVQNGWNLCYRSHNALGDDYQVVCNSTGKKLRPLIRQFAILSNNGIKEQYNRGDDEENAGVALREVQIYGDSKYIFCKQSF